MNNKTDKILVQESRDYLFRRFEDLESYVQRALRKKTCINCDKELVRGKIHYVILTKGIVWWHNLRCF